MRVNFYFRPKLSINISIERVFSVVISELNKNRGIVVSQFHVKRHIDFWAITKFFFHKADIHHITGAVNYLALAFVGRNVVLTIHDIGHWENKKNISRFIYWLLNYALVLRTVSIITVVSEFTKNKLIDKLSVPPCKVRVIPNPLADGFSHFPKKIDKNRVIILQIGSGRNKNIEPLIQAISGIPVELRLIRVFNKVLNEEIENMGIKVTWGTNLSDTEIIQEYINCDILYFASTHEGFGLPIIEAFSIGRPVITSNISPMVEISEGAAWLVNPDSSDEIRTQIEKILSDEYERSLKISKGLEISKKYSKEKVMEMYKNLYQELMV